MDLKATEQNNGRQIPWKLSDRSSTCGWENTLIYWRLGEDSTCSYMFLHSSLNICQCPVLETECFWFNSLVMFLWLGFFPPFFLCQFLYFLLYFPKISCTLCNYRLLFLNLQWKTSRWCPFPPIQVGTYADLNISLVSGHKLMSLKANQLS